MEINYFYSLTQRQFSNIEKGYARKEDFLSRERLIIMRKIMYAAMQPHLTSVIKETDIVSFSWETKLVEKLTLEEEAEMLEQQKASEAFFLRWDQRKAGKA